MCLGVDGRYDGGLRLSLVLTVLSITTFLRVYNLLVRTRCKVNLND